MRVTLYIVYTNRRDYRSSLRCPGSFLYPFPSLSLDFYNNNNKSIEGWWFYRQTFKKEEKLKRYLAFITIECG